MTRVKPEPRARPARNSRRPTAPSSEDRHLSPEDLAARFNMSLSTIYKWNSEGTGPRFMKIGKHVRYKLEDVRAWEDKQYADQAAS
ncbi:helix-turn-helix transcriptional regulator [Nonomuraea sp. NPDC050451]|uniref:helix-turn-helix transcriptional regulator n=1 Tax=Nonomuraea sp. NPDC050451 TaxID=3364364 RepID=UPI00378A60A9